MDITGTYQRAAQTRCELRHEGALSPRTRARWSPINTSHALLGRLLDAFVPEEAVVIGIDEPIERRRGAKISAKGIDRDPVRSPHAYFVNASRLRLVSLMVLGRIPWVDRVWALLFLTGLAPSERYNHARGRRPHSLLDQARQAVRLVRRWLPTREMDRVERKGCLKTTQTSQANVRSTLQRFGSSRKPLMSSGAFDHLQAGVLPGAWPPHPGDELPEVMG